MALAQAVTGVSLTHKGTNPRYTMSFSDGTSDDEYLTGTAVVNVSVAQNGHETSVYALTVNYSIPDEEPLTAD